MKLSIFYLCMLCMPILSSPSGIQIDGENENWNFVKEKSGIKIYTRITETSDIKELKIEFEVNSSLSAITALLEDTEKYKDWVYKSKDAKVVKRISESEVIYFNVIEFPWPLHDREILIHSKFRQDNITGEIIYESNACQENLVPIDSDRIRLNEYSTTWIINPKNDGKIKITYYLKSDPAGKLPTWLVNLGIDTGAFETMNNFKSLLNEPQYSNI